MSAPINSSATDHELDDQRIEIVIGTLLRTGVLLAAAVVLAVAPAQAKPKANACAFKDKQHVTVTGIARSIKTFAEEPGATIAVEGGATFAGGPDFHAMIYSASGDLSARIAEVGYGDNESGGCSASDFADFPRGAIALAPPGNCFRRDAVVNAVAAGAVVQDWRGAEVPPVLVPAPPVQM